MNDLQHDQDGDGLTLEQEYALGTDPFLQDTDGDGASDGVEVANGTDPKVFTPSDDNTLEQGYEVTVIMTETNEGPDPETLMGRGLFKMGGQTFRVFNPTNEVSWTVRLTAGQRVEFSLTDGRPNDPNVTKIMVRLLVNGESMPLELINDPTGILAPAGTYFPSETSSSSAGINAMSAGVQALAEGSSSSSSGTPPGPWYNLPGVKICYADTSDEVPDYTELLWGQSLMIEAVVSPPGALAMLSWTNKVLQGDSGYWLGGNWVERVDILNADGTPSGIYDTVTFFMQTPPHPPVPKVNLTRDPQDIAAESTWTEITDSDQRSTIIVAVQPSLAQLAVIDAISLEISEVTPNATSTPVSSYNPGTGTLVRDSTDHTKWIYTPFAEPKTEKHPDVKQVKIVPKFNGQVCGAEVQVKVYPVFQYFTTPTFRVGGLHPSTSADYENAIGYVKWKYGISVSGLSSVGYGGTSVLLGPGARGWTTPVNDCWIYLAAFNSENRCASTLGHENVHGVQGFSCKVAHQFREADNFEVPAYQWEIDNAPNNGLSLIDVTTYTQIQAYYAGLTNALPGD